MPLAKHYSSMIDRLSRVTTSGRRIGELDGLRFIALITVVVQHVYETVLAHYQQPPHDDLFSTLVRDWRIGVDLFFVISGFILAMPFAAHRLLDAKPVSLKQYYWRRVTRLEPPYLITLVIWYAVLVLYWNQSARAQLPHLLASAVYLHNIIYAGPNTYMSTINSVAWSLEIEVQFYVIAPLLACVFFVQQKWIRRGALVLAAVAIPQSFKLLLSRHIEMPQCVYGALPMFLMGFLLADIFLTDWGQSPPARRRADLLAIPGWLLLPWFFQLAGKTYHSHVILPSSSLCFILFALCWASFRSVWTKQFLASSFVMTVGGMCYTIYLLHFPMLRILGNYSPIPLIGSAAGLGLNTILYLLIWGAPVLAVSIAFFLLIEKPCMRRDWPNRLWARVRGLPVDDSSMSRPTEAERFLDVPAGTTTPLSENQPVP